MKFVIVDQHNGNSWSFTGSKLLLLLTVAGVLGIPALAGYAGYRQGIADADLTDEMVARWREVLKDQGVEVKSARQQALETLEASTLRLAKLQARIVRLDAVGERLTSVAKLDEGEFDFSGEPAVGGPETTDSSPYSPVEFVRVLDQLALDIEDREQQLSVLELLLQDRKISQDVFVAGRPVRKGWMSSRFGERSDPITGHKAMHYGVDFAGSEGAPVIAVASGVVVYAGPRSGYGQMVEINHSGGFSTRYGHHSELKVKVGDVIRKGELVGLMGSSGRSTGPHVHFEVYKNGRVVDPASYIHRASR